MQFTERDLNEEISWNNMISDRIELNTIARFCDSRKAAHGGESPVSYVKTNSYSIFNA